MALSADFLHLLGMEEIIDLAVSAGITPEAVGDLLAEADINYRSLSDLAEEQGTTFVIGNERLPRLIVAMSPEEQAEAAVKYKEWYEGDGSPASSDTSSRSALVAAQVAGRKEQEKQVGTPLTKGQARSIIVVTGFRKHSSKAPWNELEPVLLSDMALRQVASGRTLKCRIITSCLSLYSVQTVIEDEQGTTYDLSFYNYPTTFDAPPQDMDVLFPKGAVLLIREPVLMPSQQNTNPLVRVDSPTDLVVLAPYSQMLSDVHFETEAPTAPLDSLEDMQTEDYWRTEGNRLFDDFRWLPAAVAYSRGLKLTPDSLVLRLNRAEAYLRLQFYSGALHDAQSVLADPELSPASRDKALFRAAHAEYGRRNYANAKRLFQQHRVLRGKSAEDANWIRRCGDRLRESETGKYNWAKLFQECQRHSKLDVADYTGPVEVKAIPGRGRGIVVTKDVDAGALLMVSKAISFVEENDLRADVWRIALNIKTSRFMTRAQCANVAKVAQTVYGNPDIHDQLLHLYAGPDYPLPPATLPPARLDPQPVNPLEPTVDIDIARLEAICLYNTFDQYPLRPSGSEVIDDNIRRSPNALHLLPSLLNHSCAGNARVCVFGDVLVVRAVARIRAGEEVTVPYVSPEKGYNARTEALKKYFSDGQVCGCEVCEMDRADGEDALETREELRAELPTGPLYKEPMSQLRAWESALDTTYAPSRGSFRPELARLVHGIGEQLRGDDAKNVEALETNIRGLVCQGFAVADTWRPAPNLKRKLKDPLLVDPLDLSMCVGVERGVSAMLRIAQKYKADANVLQAKRWLKAALKVDDAEYGGGRGLFLLKEAKLLDGFGITKFAETVL